VEEITPGNYEQGQPIIEEIIPIQYTNGGTTPFTGEILNNELFNTTWVLTKIVTGFSTTFPNDTIKFVSNNSYTLNNGANRPYTLSPGVLSTNKTLVLSFFQPFGGSHYTGEVGYYFVTDGEISQAEFNNLQNTTPSILAWFEKID
jgi:hypothetical protein